MKKVIIFLSVILILIGGTIIILPSLLKDRIQKIAVAKANTLMNSSFSFSDFDLSLFKSFPDFTATFYNVTLIGEKSFRKDTLVSISELSARIRLPSIFKKKGIIVEEILIDKLYPYFQGNKAKVCLNTILLADHDQLGFKFKPEQTKLNDISLKVTGGFSMPSDSMLVNLQFQIPGMTMQQVFTMVPDKYRRFLNSSNTSGNVTLIGRICGRYYKDFKPAFEVSLNINNGVLKYPGLSNELMISKANAKIFKPEGILDSLTMGIDIQNLQLAENSVNFNVAFKSVMTDPTVNARLNGTIDLGTLTKIIPIDSVSLKGLIITDVAFSGKMSDIKISDFDKFVSTGNIKLKDFYFQNNSLPMGVSISQGTAELKNQYLKIDIKQLLYDQMNITDLTGGIELRNKQLKLSGFGMNMLNGTIKVDGMVMDAGGQNPNVDFNIVVKGFDLPSAYRDLSVVQKYLPFAEKMEGQFSTAFKLQSKLGKRLKLDIPSIKALGTFSTNNVKMTDPQSLNFLKSVIQISKLKNLKLDNFTAEFEIKDRNLHFNQFKTSFAEQPLSISGNYNLNGMLDFRMDATLDHEILSNEIQDIISYMPGHESIMKVDAGVNITGDSKKPDVKIDTEKIRKQVVNQLKKSSPNEIRDAAKKLLEKFLR